MIIVGSLLVPDYALWQHLLSTVFPSYALNSAIIATEVALSTMILGVGSAWVLVSYRIPGAKYWEWMLVLPLAYPSYIFAFFAQSQSHLLGVLSNREWVALCLSFTLYPYVYLGARAAFIDQSIGVIEAARTLGCSVNQAFTRVALPLARPAIVAGTSVVIMESLADYGTAEYFAVPTISTGVLRTWFGHYNLTGAAQLAATLVSLVLILAVVEQYSRRHARFHHASHRYQDLPQQELGWAAKLIWLCLLSLLVGIGFFAPTIWLLAQASSLPNFGISSAFLRLAFNSFSLAAVVSFLIVPVALWIVITRRDSKAKGWNQLQIISRFGYATPGTVMAIGVLIPLIYIDELIAYFGYAKLGLSSGFIALTYAYFARFFALAANTTEAGLMRIHHSMSESARTLGTTRAALLHRVYLPLMRGSTFAAIMLVFVDILKELPATLVLRPFDFNTLAVTAFELAADEHLALAAAPALSIVLIGLLPVIYLSKKLSQSRAGHAWRT